MTRGHGEQNPNLTTRPLIQRSEMQSYNALSGVEALCKAREGGRLRANTGREAWGQFDYRKIAARTLLCRSQFQIDPRTSCGHLQNTRVTPMKCFAASS